MSSDKSKLLLEQIKSHYCGNYAHKMRLVVFDLDGQIQFITHELALFLRLNPYAPDLAASVATNFKDMVADYKVLQEFKNIRQGLIYSKQAQRFFFNLTIDGINHSMVLLFSPIFSYAGELIGIELRVLDFNLLPIKHYIDYDITIHNRNPSLDAAVNLTQRQNDIVYYLLLGLTQKQIGEKLKISRGTVSKLISEQICPKFGLESGYTAVLLKRVLESTVKLRIPSSLMQGPRLFEF
jgi:hypothetical protein